MYNSPYYTEDTYQRVGNNNPSEDYPAFLQMTFGGVTRRIEFCEHPVIDVETGGKRVPTIAEQCYLVASNHKNHLGKGKSADTNNFLARSKVVTPDGAIDLDGIFRNSSGQTLDAIIKNGYERVGVHVPPNNAEFDRITTTMGKSSFNMMTHTGSIETLYLMADNPHAVQNFCAYMADKNRSVMHYGDSKSPTVAGMLGHAENGVKTVVLGKETKSPQGFVQGVSIFTGRVASNALNSNNEMVTARAYGESLVGAVGALRTLNKQAPTDADMPFIKKESLERVVDSIKELKINANDQSRQQYNKAKNDLMQGIGRSFMENDFSRVANQTVEAENTLAEESPTPSPTPTP